MQSTTPPKLQRIPRPGDKPFIPPPSVAPKQNNTPKISEPLKTHPSKMSPSIVRYAKPPDSQSIVEPSKSIVGSMTTWFPPNSTLKMNPNNSPTRTTSDSIRSPKPQGLVFMGERKFLVVPKGNVLSISPTIGAAVNTPPSSKGITSPTADKAPVFDAKEKTNSNNSVIPTTASLGPVNNSQPVLPPAANESPRSNLVLPVKSSISEPSDIPPAPRDPMPLAAPEETPRTHPGDHPLKE